MTIERILLDHGSGGKASDRLIKDIILPFFKNPILSQLNDGASIDISGNRLAFSTDSYVVDPIFFPGGNIGDLAINGTVNDIAMCGATPLYIGIGFIIEEGFSLEAFKKILASMKEAAQKAGVSIVTGDTKVVPKGVADKIFINTSGIGTIPKHVDISGSNAKPGDVIIVSGSIADHGITILTQREEFSFNASISSDTVPLNHMVNKMLSVCNDIHVLRDPTRGGIGSTLNEIATQSHIGIKLYEEKIPIKKEITGICDILGLDPLYVANEGKLLAVVSEKNAATVLSVMRQEETGKDACIIGKIISDHPGMVVMETQIGGSRIVDMLTGDQLPRIC